MQFLAVGRSELQAWPAGYWHWLFIYSKTFSWFDWQTQVYVLVSSPFSSKLCDEPVLRPPGIQSLPALQLQGVSLH